MSEADFEPPEEPETEDVAEKVDVEDEQDGATAPGVPFAYTVTRDDLSRQEAIFRDVNGRLGFLFAATLTFGSFYFEKVVEPWRQILIGLALIAVLILSFLGYVPRTYMHSPNPHGLVQLANQKPGAMKEKVLGSMLQAHRLNSAVIAKKNFYYGFALSIGVFVVVLAVVIELSGAAGTLWRDGHKTASARQSGRTPGLHTERKRSAPVAP